MTDARLKTVGTILLLLICLAIPSAAILAPIVGLVSVFTAFTVTETLLSVISVLLLVIAIGIFNR